MSLTSGITSLTSGTSLGRLTASGINGVTNNSSTNTSTSTSISTSGAAVDTRVRLSLPPGSELYYKDNTNALLNILQTTNGVVFPFQPSISMGYTANYNAQDLTHSNFSYYFYQNTKMEPFTINGSFVVRNPWEGSYVLAAMHFLKSCLFMFTGNDGNLAGAPPPVLRANGMGFGGLENIPVVLTSVNIEYPDDVDYVTVAVPSNNSAQNGYETTKVPVKMNITVGCTPVFSRDFAANFSTKYYATGQIRLLGASFDNLSSTDTALSTPDSGLTTTADTSYQNSYLNTGS